jgi:TRAP-type C4-dicarboxylate transport system permease small subunit
MSGKLEFFKKFSRTFNRVLRWVSMTGMVVMVITTIIDVAGAKLFRWPLPGAFEITSILGLVVIVFALPYTQMLRGHIEIDIFTGLLPKRAQSILGCFMFLLGIILFVLITWQMFDFGQGLRMDHRVTETWEIPMYPFAYGATVCFFAGILTLLLQFIQIVAEVFKK